MTQKDIEALQTLINVERDMHDRCMRLSTTDPANAQKHRQQAFEHEKRLHLYYIVLTKAGDKFLEAAGMGVAATAPEPTIVNTKGETIKKPAKEEVSTEIKNPAVAEAAKKKIEENKGTLEYPMDEALQAVFLAQHNISDKKEAIAAARKKAEYFFGDKLEEIRKKTTEAAQKDLETAVNDEQRLRKEIMLEDKINKLINLEVKSYIRQGQLEYINAIKEEAAEEAGLERTVEIKTPQEILKIGYWKDNKFNYKIFTEDGNDELTEDLVKLQAIHMHTIKKHNEAVALLRTFYKDKGWDDLKAEQFLFALLNEGEPLREVKEVVKGFIEAAKAESDTKTEKAAKLAVKKNGIKKSLSFIKGWTRTSEKDENGKWIFAITTKKMDRIVDDIVAEVFGETAEEEAE